MPISSLNIPKPDWFFPNFRQFTALVKNNELILPFKLESQNKYLNKIIDNNKIANKYLKNNIVNNSVENIIVNNQNVNENTIVNNQNVNNQNITLIGYNKEDLSKIINLPDSMLRRKVHKPNLDSLDIKVYLSDALLPIAQEKEDNSWMFKNNNFSNRDSIVFYKIVNSKKFQELNYRDFDKRKITFKKPYHQSNYSEIKAYADKPYKILKFSRICFDEKMENGIVVVEMLEGLEYGTMSGFNGAILIKKKNNHWEYIPQK